MKYLKNSTSDKTANLFNILTSLWLKKCSNLKNVCTENKIWRNDRKQAWEPISSGYSSKIGLNWALIGWTTI